MEGVSSSPPSPSPRTSPSWAASAASSSSWRVSCLFVWVRWKEGREEGKEGERERKVERAIEKSDKILSSVPPCLPPSLPSFLPPYLLLPREPLLLGENLDGHHVSIEGTIHVLHAADLREGGREGGRAK